MIKDKIILILGAGQIGEACTIRFIKDQPKKIILHTLTEKEARQAVENVNEQIDPGQTKLIASWGNVLVPKTLIHTNREDLLHNPNNLDTLLNYYYANLSDDVIINSSFYQIVKKYKPNLIVDAINTATVVGYLDDPYSLPRKILHEFVSETEINWPLNCKRILSSAIIPSLIRFTQVIQKVIKDFNIDYYIKVSTTGLGGMGVNLMYTHGDVNEPGMSSGILGKVAAAGVFHQLMWSLSHTPGYNIRLIAPAALVGWQPVRFGAFRSHGKNIKVIDNKKFSTLRDGEILETKIASTNSGKYVEIPYVDSGENSAYSLYEMHAITSLGQMESITREEVAEAVYESCAGSTKYDLLTTMDYAALGPTYGAVFQRTTVLDKLKKLQEEKKTPSIATNNLGPTVSKHLFEIYILLDINNYDIHRLINQDPKKICNLVKRYILNNDIVRKQALSLGLPILFDDNQIILSEHFFIPTMSNTNIVSKENINKWANAGWIDLRGENIGRWIKYLQKALTGYTKNQNNTTANLSINYKAVHSKNIGEILGLIYSMQGGARKK